MKTVCKRLLILVILTGGIFIADLSADPPSEPPPLPEGGHGGGNNQPPAGAPIDGGLGILFVLGFAFAGIKGYKSRREGMENR
ncbi:MAG: hypothetical protein NTW16_18265 [Bacteroidetes bacterium]|nr:hypothetical protein [Bacteroidota bacterium]